MDRDRELLIVTPLAVPLSLHQLFRDQEEAEHYRWLSAKFRHLKKKSCGKWGSSEVSGKPQILLPCMIYLIPSYVTQSGWASHSLEVLVSFQGL